MHLGILLLLLSNCSKAGLNATKLISIGFHQTLAALNFRRLQFIKFNNYVPMYSMLLFIHVKCTHFINC